MTDMKLMKTVSFFPCCRRMASTSAAPGSFSFRQSRADVSRTMVSAADGIFPSASQQGSRYTLGGRSAKRGNRVLRHRENVNHLSVLRPFQLLVSLELEALADAGWNRRLASVAERG